MTIHSNPFDLWLLCGINGSCMDLASLAMVNGGAFGLSHVIWNTSEAFECQASLNPERNNITFGPTPVCLTPPFLFLLFNGTNNILENDTLSCSNDTCFYSLCWNATIFPTAVVIRIPEHLPLPVDGPSFLSLYRPKRDFGITAAIIAAIAAAAMVTSVTTAQTLNDLSSQTAEALTMQGNINAHLRGGIMILNQRVDLIQDQIDVLWRLAQFGCEWHTPALCLTGIPFDNMSYAANLSRELSGYLTGNWSKKFDTLTEELRVEIIKINATRVDPVVASTLMSWIQQAASHLKEWAGLRALGICLVLLCILCLCCLRKLFHQRATDQVLIAQAFAAIELGQSPQIWLAAMGKFH